MYLQQRSSNNFDVRAYSNIDGVSSLLLAELTTNISVDVVCQLPHGCTNLCCAWCGAEVESVGAGDLIAKMMMAGSVAAGAKRKVENRK
jgi:hypothetical protein